jgi:hypothetical protein
MQKSDLHISSLGSLLAEALASLSDVEAEQLLHDWRFLARPEEIAPEGDWRAWILRSAFEGCLQNTGQQSFCRNESNEFIRQRATVALS